MTGIRNGKNKMGVQRRCCIIYGCSRFRPVVLEVKTMLRNFTIY